MVPGTCKFGGDLPFLCGILGLSTTWIVPSPFSYGIWSDVHQEFIGWERQRTPEEDAQGRGKLPVVQAGKRVRYEPMFDTDRSSFFPCILHIMIICGKLVLSFTRKVALDLPNDRVRLLRASFKAANIRWRGLHKDSAPDGQEVQCLLFAWDTVAHVLSIHRSAADEAVRQLGEVLRQLYHSGPPVDRLEDQVELAARNFQLHCVPNSKSSYLYTLIHDMKTIISECCNLGVGLAMFSNDLTETMNSFMKGIYLQHSSRGLGSATEYGLGEAFAQRQAILHVFLLNHAHLEAYGVPRPCTSRLASLDRSMEKPKWTEAEAGEWMLWFSSTPAPDIWNISIPEGKQKGRPPVTSAPPPAIRSTSAPLQEPSEPPSPVAAAPNWSATLMAAVTAGLQENATKQRQYEIGNL